MNHDPAVGANVLAAGLLFYIIIVAIIILGRREDLRPSQETSGAGSRR